jgi:TM2 domain-containing membrane protein YozV
MHCSGCGAGPLDPAALFCPRCGKPVADSGGERVIVVRSGRSPGVAAVLSFFWCGLGQIYNGEFAKGIAMMIAYAFSALLIYVLIGFITTPILWIWGMIDAYRTAERFNLRNGVT